jgi:hypothetical protein
VRGRARHRAAAELTAIVVAPAPDVAGRERHGAGRINPIGEQVNRYYCAPSDNLGCIARPVDAGARRSPAGGAPHLFAVVQIDSMFVHSKSLPHVAPSATLPVNTSSHASGKAGPSFQNAVHTGAESPDSPVTHAPAAVASNVILPAVIDASMAAAS